MGERGKKREKGRPFDYGLQKTFGPPLKAKDSGIPCRSINACTQTLKSRLIKIKI